MTDHPRIIAVTYSSIDGVHKHRKFKTLARARAFATKWVGEHPTIGSTYAVSDDGVGKVMVDGVSLFTLFGETPWPTKQPDGSWL